MENGRPDCFGDLEQVFPLSEDGLRHSPEKCLSCAEKTRCLKTAMDGENRVLMEEERVDRAYQSGRISFLMRWSKKKTLSMRRMKTKP